MKYVLFYESAPDVRAKTVALFPEHRALWAEFGARGDLLMIGPFADPQAGALAIFSSRRAAEAFVERDPFVRQGVVAAWRIQEWNEALVPDRPLGPAQHLTD